MTEEAMTREILCRPLSANMYICQKCGKATPGPVQISPDPDAPRWCHECAYEGVPDYREFIDKLEAFEPPLAECSEPVAEGTEDGE